MFDLTDINSFATLNFTIKNIRNLTFAEVEIFLVRNKSDLKYLREISQKTAINLKTTEDLTEYIEISCFNGFNIDTLIKSVFKQYKQIFFKKYNFN